MSFPRYPIYKDSGVEWLREVPQHWELNRLKRYVRLLTEKTDRREHPVALENIESWTGRLISTDSKFEGDGVAFDAGDILFGKLRPYLAKVLVAEVAGEAIGDFHVMRPQSRVDGRFLQYFMLSREFISIVDGSTFGSKMPRASWDFVGSMVMCLPLPSEQTSITRFLDCETAKIDELIAEQHRLIDLLKEKRQAVISHTVTKGLKPGAPTKPSDGEWLDDMPAHWDSLSVRRCVLEHRQGYYSTDPYVDSGVKLLRITDLRAHGAVDFSECPHVEDRTELEPFLLMNSDFVFARTGGAGSFGFIESIGERAIYASYLIRFRFKPRASPSFLRYYFLSSHFQQGVRKNIHGGVNQNVHAEDIKNQYLSLPPLSEQNDIVEELNRSTAESEDLTSEAEQAIALLQERRTALISAAVTGKIDVRGRIDAEAA